MDNTTTIEKLKLIAQKFIDDRDWDQYHTLKNLSIDISLEAAELMEPFVWARNEEEITYILKTKKKEIENEVADVLFALLNFCNKADIDLSKSFEEKMILNAKKYPIEKVKGKSEKYTEYV